MTAPAPEKAAPIPAEVLELAHELWAAAQLGPLEGITDGVDRVADLLADQAREEARITRADRASQEENPRPAKTGGLETAVLRQPQEERIREKDDDTRLSLDVEWEERIREYERAEAREQRSAALMDCQYVAGAQAGWNCAQADNPNEAFAALIKSRDGRIAALKQARERLRGVAS